MLYTMVAHFTQAINLPVKNNLVKRRNIPEH